MTMNKIKNCVALRIATSTSRTIPASLQNWAQNHIETLSGTDSNTSDDTYDHSSPGSPTPERVSSASTLPVLELVLENTKIAPKSCLKTGPRSSQGDDEPPAKRAVFVHDDRLLTCMRTGFHFHPRVMTPKMREDFQQRNWDRAEQRRINQLARRLALEAGGVTPAEGSSSSPAEDGDDVDDIDDIDDQTKWDNYNSEDEDEFGFDLEDPIERVLKVHAAEARQRKEKYTIETIKEGGLDFALYVTRDKDMLESLENWAMQYCPRRSVGSFLSDERRHAFRGVQATTKMPFDYYVDYSTAMSGNRTPQPLTQKEKKAVVAAYSVATSPQVESSSKAESIPAQGQEQAEASSSATT